MVETWENARSEYPVQFHAGHVVGGCSQLLSLGSLLLFLFPLSLFCDARSSRFPSAQPGHSAALLILFLIVTTQ